MTYPNPSLNLPVTVVNSIYESSPTIQGKKYPHSHPYYTMIYCLSLSNNTEDKELKK